MNWRRLPRDFADFLEEEAIDYAITGAYALILYKPYRVTIDVDVVTPGIETEQVERMKEAIESSDRFSIESGALRLGEPLHLRWGDKVRIDVIREEKIPERWITERKTKGA